ncbi:MAG TPA: DUF6580 family putative transport protein [Saprospiraceae bacterium]|nr:DUF6580 family putative transport protein [Saprospiraceae bacterium]
MKAIKNASLLWVIVLIFVAVLFRLINHPVNFTPLGAMMLFGGVQSKKFKLSILVPFIALFLSDLYLNNFMYHSDQWTWFYKGAPWVYFAFALVFIIGRIFQPKLGLKLAFTAISGSIIFFVVTNLALWYGSNLYTKDTAGLVQCFIAALPFFQNSLFGDLIYSFAIFGVYEYISIKSRSATVA